MQITTTEMITVDFGEANGDRKNKNNLKIVKRENNCEKTSELSHWLKIFQLEKMAKEIN